MEAELGTTEVAHSGEGREIQTLKSWGWGAPVSTVAASSATAEAVVKSQLARV